MYSFNFGRYGGTARVRSLREQDSDKLGSDAQALIDYWTTWMDDGNGLLSYISNFANVDLK